MIKSKVAIFRSNLLKISETFIRDQANALTEWEPILVGRRNVEDGLPTPNLRREIVSEHGSLLSQRIRFWRWAPDPNLTKRLKELDARLVHAHFGTNATEIWPSVRSAGLPMLVTLHGFDINIHKEWWTSGHGGLRGRVYPSRLLRIAQHPEVNFIAVSNAIKRRAIEYGIPAQKVTVSHIGVDTHRFRPGGLPLVQRRKRILFVGRMVEKKAPLLMIRAYTEVRKTIRDAELIMIGDGPLLSKAYELATQLNAPVEFLGACTSDQVLNEIQHARVFCLPSITAENGDAEGLPISLLEAQASGVPVVTSRSGGAAEAVSAGQSGLILSDDSPESLCILLHHLLSSQCDISDLSTNARKHVLENHNILQCTARLEQLYSIEREKHGNKIGA